MWIRKEEKGSEGRGMNDGQKLKYARVRGESIPWENKHQHPRYRSHGGSPCPLSLSLDSIHVYIDILSTTCLATLNSQVILLDHRAETAFEIERHRPLPKIS